MNKIYLVLAAFCFTLLNISGDVFAAEHSNQITVEGSYIRAKIPGTDITSAYMTIKNKGDEAVMLIGASSQFSDRIEIHQHTMSDGMMKMRQVQQLLIKDKNQVILQPMGYHLMIFNVIWMNVVLKIIIIRKQCTLVTKLIVCRVVIVTNQYIVKVVAHYLVCLLLILSRL